MLHLEAEPGLTPTPKPTYSRVPLCIQAAKRKSPCRRADVESASALSRAFCSSLRESESFKGPASTNAGDRSKVPQCAPASVNFLYPRPTGRQPYSPRPQDRWPTAWLSPREGLARNDPLKRDRSAHRPAGHRICPVARRQTGRNRQPARPRRRQSSPATQANSALMSFSSGRSMRR